MSVILIAKLKLIHFKAMSTWPCDYCDNDVEIPDAVCPECSTKDSVQHDLLLKHQAHQLYSILRRKTRKRTGSS